MSFIRPVRITTAPIEALFPYALNQRFPVPEGCEFKSISLETIYLHFRDKEMLQRMEMPKGMRKFTDVTNKTALRSYDGGIRCFDHPAHPALGFHLVYDIKAHAIDGYVDYGMKPSSDSFDFIEMEYVLIFNPIIKG